MSEFTPKHPKWGFCCPCERYGRRCKPVNGKCSMKTEEANNTNIKLKASVRLDAYKIIDDVVEKAVRYGYHRAYKHVDNPTEHSLISEIHRSVMNELCELLKFDE